MDKDLFTIKGSKYGLTIVCDEQAAWSEVLNSLKNRIQGKERDFLAGAKVTVELGNRLLNNQEVTALWALLEDNQIFIKNLRSGKTEKTEQKRDYSKIRDCSTLPTLVVDRGLRSGQKITYDGNLILFGDVNPGAEIETTGFTLIWGDLRGTVHVGITGNQKAWVAAQRLQPTQLRIAHYITRAPEEEPQEAEIAEIEDEMIVVRQLRKTNIGKLHLVDEH